MRKPVIRRPAIRRPKLSLEREGVIGEIGLVLLAICAILVGLTAAFSLGIQKQNENRSARAYGKQVCSVLASAAATAIASGDEATLRTLVQSLTTKRGLVYAAVADAEGQVLVETAHKDAGDDVHAFSLKPGAGRTRVIQAEDREIVSLTTPIVFDGRRVGIAQVVMAETSTFIAPHRFSQFVGIVALVSFLLVGAAYAYLRMILRPLPKLIRELSQQIDDKTIRRIEFKGRRGQLCDLINRWNDAVRVFHEKIADVDQTNAEPEIDKHVLAYEKKRVESIIGFLPIGVLVTNSSGNVAMANRAAQNLLLKPDSQLLGESVGTALGQESLDEALRQNRATRAFELSLDGSTERIVKVTITDLSSPGRETIGSLVTIREITQQKMADRMTSEFVNHVAHEFRTPLASIRAYTEMLVDDQVDDENTRFEFYNTIAQETERLTGLIGNLLNISKMEAGSLTANKVPVRIDKVISEVAGGIEPQATAKGLTFRVDVPDPAPQMEMDKALASVALVNLIGNAVKYTPEGGTVEVIAKAEESSLAIRVRDTGPGIEEEDLLHIFEKFYRSGDEKIQEQTGSGLGLALAQQIAFIHGGEITVTSEPGKGAEFCLSLPIAAGKQVPLEVGGER